MSDSSDKTKTTSNNEQKKVTVTTAEAIAQAMLKKHQQRNQLAQGKSSSTGTLKVGPFARIKESEKKRSSIPSYESDDDQESESKKN
uniref:PEST proteolytic signal-containing nuclear protein n=1 Tax=Parastrongyloides trichosuri TaxID=131310 RepID=A0A0N4ZUC8_PARTI